MSEHSTGKSHGIGKEVNRRRTFAIISHPDAGKTTLAEKLLLYSGALHLAGAVRGGNSTSATASDWMAMEQQRGISISATALEMDYMGYRINLLDTPGHQDFSEDTYRTLMAVDSAVMVLDCAKGIEPQTEKLFKVCRMQNMPIITFINKMDHPGRDRLELLDEIEQMLGITAAPMNWPIGEDIDFKGVYDFENHQVQLYQRTSRGKFKAPLTVTGIDDPELARIIGESAHSKLHGEVELLKGVGNTFNREGFIAGNLTPVFFGSALNNFGVEPFLNALINLAPHPKARETGEGAIDPNGEDFYGFIFKVQANLDPRHRDRMAFMRVCGGKFVKDMPVFNPRLAKEVKLTRAFRLFAREREPIEEAFPGDVIGLISPGLFAIGDTVTNGRHLKYAEIPRFPPEHFAVLHNKVFSRYKQFNKGLQQLEEEGAIQVLYSQSTQRREPVLAAVGVLQFDVVLSRLEQEYGVEARKEVLPFSCARWVEGEKEAIDKVFGLRSHDRQFRDLQGRMVLLFSSSWEVDYCQKENPGVTFREMV